METNYPIFNTEGITGFVNIFLGFPEDKEKQLELANSLVAKEPDSPSGQAASRWLVLRGF